MRRIASGLMPNSRAAASTRRSSRYAASGRPALDELERDNACGSRECGVGRLCVAHVIVPVEDDIPGNVVEKLGRTWADRILSLGYCGQRVVLDFDRFSGITRSG